MVANRPHEQAPMTISAFTDIDPAVLPLFHFIRDACFLVQHHTSFTTKLKLERRRLSPPAP